MTKDVNESKAGMETVTFEWSTEKGRCYDCNLPAAYKLTHITLDPGDFLLCALDAAYHASHGDEITYLYDEEDEEEANDQPDPV